MRIPQRRKHKASGNDRCRYKKKEYWFGPSGSEESDRRYNAWVQELLAGNPAPPTNQSTVCVLELALRFMRYAKLRYSSGEFHNLKQASNVLVKTHGETICNQFGPRALLEVRSAMVAKGWPRGRVNQQVGRVRRIFRWGVQQEFVRVHTALALREILPLRRSECATSESEPVGPASDKQIAAICAEVTPTIRAMIMTARLVGMRPSELFAMRPADIDQSEDVWVYRPTQFKTKWRGLKLAYAIGPNAQAILKPYLKRPDTAFLFTPAQAMLEDRAMRAAKRKTKASPSHIAKKKATKPPTNSGPYNRTSFRNAIARAAMRLALDDKEKFREFYFTPNQLRHARATELRAKFGIEQARAALAHSDVATTLIYAEADLAAAKDIARATG